MHTPWAYAYMAVAVASVVYAIVTNSTDAVLLALILWAESRIVDLGAEVRHLQTRVDRTEDEA